MRSFRPRRRSSAAPQPATGSFWTLSRVLVAIALVAWVLTIFILFRQREWSGNQQRGIIVIESRPDEVRQPVTLVIMKPDNKVLLMPIPAQQKIETPFNYGTYSSDALVGLTQLEELDWEYLEYTLALEFGVSLDGIVWTDTPVSSLGDLRSLGLQAMLNRRASTLSWWDRMTWWRWLQQVPSYQLETVNLSSYLVSETNMLDTTRYDRWAELYLQDPDIRGNGFSVSVQNGSGIEGYASRVGRMVGLMGYDLRSIDTVGTSTISELLWAEDLQSDNWSAQRLQSVLAPFRARVDQGANEQARSQAIIRLGTDQATLFQSRR